MDWFFKTIKTKVIWPENICNGLLFDNKAVENGIRLPWSNGAVEGYENRIRVLSTKCIEGQVFN